MNDKWEYLGLVAGRRGHNDSQPVDQRSITIIMILIDTANKRPSNDQTSNI